MSSRASRRSAIAVHVETPAKFLVPLCVLACVAAVAAVLYAAHVDRAAALREESWRMAFEALTRECKDTKTQAWLTERRLVDMESYAMLNGWKVTGDDAHGPTGNLQRMLPKEAREYGRK